MATAAGGACACALCLECHVSATATWKPRALRACVCAGMPAQDVLLERAIGAIYRPHTERWSHYFVSAACSAGRLPQAQVRHTVQGGTRRCHCAQRLKWGGGLPWAKASPASVCGPAVVQCAVRGACSWAWIAAVPWYSARRRHAHDSHSPIEKACAHACATAACRPPGQGPLPTRARCLCVRRTRTSRASSTHSSTWTSRARCVRACVRMFVRARVGGGCVLACVDVRP